MTTKTLLFAISVIFCLSCSTSKKAGVPETGVALRIDSVQNTATFTDLTVFFSLTNNTEAPVVMAAPRSSTTSKTFPEFFNYSAGGYSCEVSFAEVSISVKRLDDFVTVEPGSSEVFTLKPHQFDDSYCEPEAPGPQSFQITYIPNPGTNWKARYIKNLKYYGHEAEASKLTELIVLMPKDTLVSNTFEFEATGTY